MRAGGSRLRSVSIATAVTGLASVAMLAVSPAASAAPWNGLGYDPFTTKGSLYNISAAVGAHTSYALGYTGKGVGVALIDTGVAPVDGLTSGNVYNGPDLSFDSQDPELNHLDAYGHGTHMASIIAGRDVAGSPLSYLNPTRFNGIAPDANLVSVKVGATDGAVDVTQIIAAIDWTVAHRNDNGLNIRVINLSYGTDGIQDTMVDPMDYAVENAWKHGIVVVVAGGNDGTAKTSLANPARDPYVLAVGADDTQGTTSAYDDTVPDWGTGGTDARHVDLVAPGVSVLGLRVPNGYCDERNPTARVGDRFAKASGTSQATAVVSGEVALLLQRYPTMTPDQVKYQLMSTATSFPSSTTKYEGTGLTSVALAEFRKPEKYVQKGLVTSTGTGSIEASRGTSHVYDGVSELTGEFDIFGNPWDGAAWAAADVAGTVWDAGQWRGFGWSGDGWDARTWRSVEWASGTWSARTWRDSEWSARTWRDGAWSARTWRDGGWTDNSWSARTWRDSQWSARTWRDAAFTSVGWQ